MLDQFPTSSVAVFETAMWVTGNINVCMKQS